MKKVLLLGWVVVLPLFLSAQQASPTKSTSTAVERPASRAEILQLFQILRLQKQMEEMQKTMSAQMEQTFQSISKEQQGSKLTPQQREKIDSLMKDYIRESQNVYPVAEMIEDIVPVYQRNLTSDDVHTISAFYQSPAGQTYLNKAPKMMQETMAVIIPKMQQRLKQEITVMNKKMEEATQETPSAPPATKN